MELEKNQKTADNRRNPLKDNEEEGLKVTAPLRDQIIDKLVKKLNEDNVGMQVTKLWHQANADRSEWLERQDKYLQEIDEFINPIYPQALDWSSNLHLPTTLIICKTYHARMYSALMAIDPPFTVRARKGENVDRAVLVEELMRYTLRDWANRNEGVEHSVDRWIWEWVTRGVGVLKVRWEKEFSRFMDVEVEQIQDVDLEYDPQTGESVPVPVMREIEREVAKTIEVFDGPVVECVPLEDVVMVGGEGNAQDADYIIHRTYLTASELWQKVDQKIFKKDIVEEVIKGGPDPVTGTDQTSAIQQRRIEQAGMAMLDRDHDLDRYEILESYLKVDVDGSGITSDIIVWVHGRSGKILRATYLRRTMPSGLKPFAAIHFHRRFGTEYSVGIPELIYSLAKEIDAIHNMKVDIGILSSMPIGFYRPTTSSLKDERLPLEPGALIPLDNPSQDIVFPNMGNRVSFGMQEEQALQLQIERLTSISDLNLGIISGQGATRTATGTRALLGESSNNLSIYITRMGRGWKHVLKYLFGQLQIRLKPGFQFRILGDDGNAYWKQVETREEIQGLYDFEIESNSANSNKQVQVETANLIYQLTGNPLDLQLGIISPLERYEAVSNLLKANGIKNVSKYVRKPNQVARQFTPIEIANRILSGIDTPLDPTQDLQGFLTVVQEIVNNDELNGQFNEFQIAALVAKAQEAQGLMAAIQQQEAQAMAAQQMQMNGMAAQTPGNMQPVAVNQPAPEGEGG